MQAARWYDKYSDLKSILQTLKGVDEDILELITQDFIQIVLSRYNNQLDSVIMNTSANLPPDYKRWYDRNYNLHTCVEFIKTIDDDNERIRLINDFVATVLTFISDNNND